ncbi:MAG: ATP-binding protein [Chloroflexota bacterium]
MAVMKRMIAVPATLASIESAMGFVMSAAVDVSFPATKQYGLRLAVEEFLVNSIRHGYIAHELVGEIHIHVELSSDYFVVTIVDSAPPFNPESLVEPESLHKPAEERVIGGLGVYIAMQQLDKYHYKYQDGKNKNTLVFECPTEAITQLMLNQMTVVDGMGDDLIASIHSMGVEIQRLRDDLRQAQALLTEHNIELLQPAPSNHVDDLIMTSKKHADRVVTHLYQFQDFLRISSSIYSTFALDIVLDTVLKQVLTLTNAYRAILFLRDPEQKSLHIEATRTKDGQHMSAYEMPYNREIVEQVFNSKQPIMMDARQQEANLPFHAIICVSLMLHGEAIGVLYADSKFDNANLNKDLI